MGLGDGIRDATLGGRPAVTAGGGDGAAAALFMEGELWIIRFTGPDAAATLGHVLHSLEISRPASRSVP